MRDTSPLSPPPPTSASAPAPTPTTSISSQQQAEGDGDNTVTHSQEARASPWECVCRGARRGARLVAGKKERALWITCVQLILDFGVFDLITPLLPAYQTDLGLSTTQVGGFMAIWAVAGLVTAIPTGYFASLTQHYNIWMAGSAAVLSVSLLGFSFATTYTGLMVSRVFQGIGSGISWTVCTAYLVYPYSNNFPWALGISQSMAFFGPLIAPVLSGWLYEVNDDVFLPCIVAAIISFFVTLLNLALPSFKKEIEVFTEDVISEPPVEGTDPVAQIPQKEQVDEVKNSAPDEERKLIGHDRVTLFDMAKHPGTWCAFADLAAAFMFFGFTYEAIPLYMTDELGYNSGAIGTVFSAGFLLNIAGTLCLGKLLDKWHWFVIPSMVILGFGTILLSLVLVNITDPIGFAFCYAVYATILQMGFLPPFVMYFNTIVDIQKKKGVRSFQDSENVFGLHCTSLFLGFSMSFLMVPGWSCCGLFVAYLTGGVIYAVVVIVDVAYGIFGICSKKKRTALETTEPHDVT
ncbi:Major Facilitator Superfamily [Pelomyxa schiedti]|nr:Major Facilitator Superfamily [Pelomyxa schiedti]